MRVLLLDPDGSYRVLSPYLVEYDLDEHRLYFFCDNSFYSVPVSSIHRANCLIYSLYSLGSLRFTNEPCESD